MNRGKNPQGVRVGGYTIVETLIFLAVSAAMFVSAMALISGQQNKVQFVNDVRDFEAQMTDVANNVSTGFYNNSATFSCTKDVLNRPVISVGANTVGTHGECIFIGTVVRLGDSGSRDVYDEYPMAGARLSATGNDVINLVQANPAPIDVSGSVLRKNLHYGTTIVCVYSATPIGPCPNTPNMAVGFFNKFRDPSNNASQTTVTNTDLMLFNAINISDSALATKSKIDSKSLINPYTSGVIQTNPTSGVTICLKSGGTKQYALIRIASGNSSSMTVSSEIKPYNGATPPCI